MSARRHDLEVLLPARTGALADLGQALGDAGVSLEGGGVFTHGGRAIAHYLVDDGAAALSAVAAAGLGRAVLGDVVMARLDQETPGQLGALTRTIADAGITILVQYSDHAGNLVLVVPEEDTAACRRLARSWKQAGAGVEDAP